MKLLVMSDLHLEKRTLVPASGAPMPDFDVLICAGDVFDGDVGQSIQFVREVAGAKPAIFVAGNHEYWGYLVEDVIEKGRAIAQEHPNFHFLENESVMIGGVIFAGATLWESTPIAREDDYALSGSMFGGREPPVTPESGYGQKILSRVPREAERPDLSKILTGAQLHPAPHPATRYGQGIDMHGPDFDRPAKWRDIQRLHEASVDYLHGCGADVIVTHFPPSPAVFHKVKAPLWICGHEHGHKDLAIGDRRLVRNALGYPGQEYLGYVENFVIEMEPKPRIGQETAVGASERREALTAYSRGELTRSECMGRLNMEISDVAAFAALMNSEKIAWPLVDREAAESAADKLLNFLDTDQDEKPKPARETTVRSDEDPLGYDTSDPQRTMLQMARDAQSGATKEAVQTELAKVRTTYNAESDPDPANEDNDDGAPKFKP